MAIDSRTAGLTVLALIAFASNSLLTRLALGAGRIDAASFTSIRLVSGAIVLLALVRARDRAWPSLLDRGAVGPLALFIYAAPFSFAYLRIGAAVGALVLFGVVQLTMIGTGIARGERPTAVAWIGLVLAAAGLLILTLPSVDRPDPLGVAMMAVAGVAWGVYSLAGRSSGDPIAANAHGFFWSGLLAAAISVALHESMRATGPGIALALVSGAVTSGLGYAIWYRALPRLSVTQAAVAQLSVPVIAALGAALLLSEPISARLLLSGAAILSGVALVLTARARRAT